MEEDSSCNSSSFSNSHETVAALSKSRSSFTLLDPFDDGPAVATLVHMSSMTLPPNIRRPRSSTELLRDARLSKPPKALTNSRRSSRNFDEVLFDTERVSRDTPPRPNSNGERSHRSATNAAPSLDGQSHSNLSKTRLVKSMARPGVGLEMWPSAKDLQQKDQADLHFQGCMRCGGCFKRLSRKQRIVMHCLILLLIIGTAVSVGFGVQHN